MKQILSYVDTAVYSQPYLIELIFIIIILSSVILL